MHALPICFSFERARLIVEGAGQGTQSAVAVLLIMLLTCPDEHGTILVKNAGNSNSYDKNCPAGRKSCKKTKNWS
jgi:hypothetical protein